MELSEEKADDRSVAPPIATAIRIQDLTSVRRENTVLACWLHESSRCFSCKAVDSAAPSDPVRRGIMASEEVFPQLFEVCCMWNEKQPLPLTKEDNSGV